MDHTVDWNAIKTEYITDARSSYRALAEKYGVPRRTLEDRARAEGWCAKRGQSRGKIVAKTVAAKEKEQVDRALKILKISDRLVLRLDRITADVDSLDLGKIDRIADVLKKIRDVQMIRSDADVREQEARIAKLNRECETEQAQEVRIVFGEGDEEYAK